MKTYYDCIPCLLRQTIEVMRLCSADELTQEKLLRYVLQKMADMDLNETPPYMAGLIHRKTKEVLDNQDPYQKIKEQFNHLALDMYGDLQDGESISTQDFREYSLYEIIREKSK